MSGMRVAIDLRSEFNFWRFGARHREALSARFRNVAFAEIERPAEAIETLRTAEVYFGWRFDPAWFEIASALKWIASPAAGTDHLPLHEAGRRGVAVSRSFGFHGRPMAEHVMGFVLGFARGLFQGAALQRARPWWKAEAAAEFFDVADATMTIVGCGAVGHEVARLASACGMEVLGVRRRPPPLMAAPEGSHVARWYSALSVDDALRAARVVVDLLPATAATRNFFDARRFGAMSPGTVFINVGRGSTVDETALILALDAGQIGWCGLDVTARKPPGLDDPLRHHPRVVMTPKTSVFCHRYMDLAVDFFADELDRYCTGLPPRGQLATPTAARPSGPVIEESACHARTVDS